MFEVNYWGSHPSEENDDLWVTFDFTTLEEARAKFTQPPQFEGGEAVTSVAFIELTGPGAHEIRANPGYDADKAATEQLTWDRECRLELAMEAGMAFGCDGYNDAMEGW